MDIERWTSNITIFNLTLIGGFGYTAFLGASSYILFKNVHTTIAKGEYGSAYIGIRAQSQANANPVVDIGSWSHYLYFDNVTFNGTTSHGLETFNAYNIYIKTIKATDCAQCAVLLNCSYNVWINKVIGIRCCPNGTYAAIRFANEVGPNINNHYVYSESSGHGIFLASSCNGITFVKINLINCHAEPILVGGSGGLHIQSGRIISNGGEIKHTNFNGETGITNASTGTAIFLKNGSSSQFMPQWNNIFENIKITNFYNVILERYNMSSNYNVYNNIVTSDCQQFKVAAGDGGGTSEDIGFAFCLFDGQKGPGNDIITGDKIYNGDYTYALNSDSTSYILVEYSGLNSVIMIPKKFKGKPISKIGCFAFYGNKNLISVTINYNIKSVGGLSFGDCKNLKILTFEENGKYEVRHCAFRGCDNLSKVDLTGVKILRSSCFALCKSLKKIVYPKTVTYFGANCF